MDIFFNCKALWTQIILKKICINNIYAWYTSYHRPEFIVRRKTWQWNDECILRSLFKNEIEIFKDFFFAFQLKFSRELLYDEEFLYAT